MEKKSDPSDPATALSNQIPVYNGYFFKSDRIIVKRTGMVRLLFDNYDQCTLANHDEYSRSKLEQRYGIIQIYFENQS